MTPSFQRVAARYLEAALTFEEEPSPRVPGALRLSIIDSEAAPPTGADYLFKTQMRNFSDRRPFKKLKTPKVDVPGVTNPSTVAYIDYSRQGPGGYYIHLVIVRPSQRGTGLAMKLLREFYRKVPEGGAVAWGRVLNPTAWALYEKMQRERPDVRHSASRFF